MRGADLFAQTLRATGVTTVCSVSGNQILVLYDALAAAGVRIVHMRHESAAAYAAAGWAEVTGETGVVLVAGGPGFLASLVGVGVAASMELPLLLVSGGPPTTGDRPGAFQYLDQATIARTLCKRTHKIASADSIDADLTRALRDSQAGIPGPVHLTLPVDVASHEIAERSPLIESESESAASLNGNEEKTLAKIAASLRAAQRPLLIARPSANRGVAGKALRELGARLGVAPVVMESPRGSEDLKYRAITSQYPDADYALVIGPADFAVHFLAQERLARNGRLALIDFEGDPEPKRSLDAHLRTEPSLALEQLVGRIPLDHRTSWISPATTAEVQSTSALHPLTVGNLLREMFGSEDLIVLDGGEFGQWLRLAFANSGHEVIWNSRLGAIGGSIPLALGAALAQPDRRVAVAVGDGAFGYHGAELETAVREGANLIVIVGNDDRWAAEWHTQREKYGRAVATMLGTVNYDEVARGYGAQGYEADDDVSLRRALSLARSADEPVCINVRIASVRSPATAP